MDRTVTIRQLAQRERGRRPRRSPGAGAGAFAAAAKRHVRGTRGRLSTAGRRAIWNATVERMMKPR
jgi:hypothetical protein